MLSLTTEVRNLLAQDAVDSVVLVDLLWPTLAGGPQYLTDNPYPIIFNSNTYTTGQGLLNLSAPQVVSVIDRDQFTITLSDNQNVFNSRVEAAPTGWMMNTQILLKNPDGSVVSSGLPVYTGICSGAAFSRNGPDRVLQLEFTSPLTKLTAVNERVTSDAEQRAVNVNDTSMIHVIDSVNEATAKWGRV